MVFSTIFRCSGKNPWNTLKWITLSQVLLEKDHRFDITTQDWKVVDHNLLETQLKLDKDRQCIKHLKLFKLLLHNNPRKML